MKTLFESLEKRSEQFTTGEMMQEVDGFTQHLIESQDKALLSISKGWSGHGTWKVSVFVNEYHYGEKLTSLLEKAINGATTHSEDKEFTIEEFTEKISDEIYEHLFNLDHEAIEEE